MNMKNSKNKMKSASLALFLVFAMTSTLAFLPSASAHDPVWNVPTYAYVTATPNPVGVNQQVYVTMWIDKVPPTADGIAGDRWTNYTVQITAPDGTTVTKGPYNSAAESTYTFGFIPTQTGTYTLLFNYPGQIASLYNPDNGLPGDPSASVGDNYLGSHATTTLTVQSAQVTAVPDYPLPTSYWTRPIEGENTASASIASNYLGSPHISNLVQPTGAAPNSAHIMWSKEFGFGGIVGGNYASSASVAYYDYNSYETQFSSAFIIDGRVYY
jgi:hypothetical protein